MSAVTILQSVVAIWTAQGGSDFAGSGGVWLEEVPEKKPLPFLVLFGGIEQTDFTSEDDFSEPGTLTLKVYQETVGATDTLAVTVKRFFDGFTKRPRQLDFAGGLVTQWYRTGYGLKLAPFRNESGKQVGEATIPYRYTVQRSLPA